MKWHSQVIFGNLAKEATIVDIQIDSQDFKEIFSQAILSCLSQEKKEEMIASALSYLTNPKKGHYGGQKGTTPLEDVFYEALRFHARDSITKYLKENLEFEELITQLLEQAIRKIKDEKFEKMTDKLASKIIETLSGCDY